MNGYEDMKEHTRRRELGFNANNPWSREKEAIYRDRRRLEEGSTKAKYNKAHKKKNKQL